MGVDVCMCMSCSSKRGIIVVFSHYSHANYNVSMLVLCVIAAKELGCQPR